MRSDISLSGGVSPCVPCWVLSVLSPPQDDQTPLHISSRLGKPDIVLQLLASGASPDATTHSGYTPLHLAAQEGRPDMAALLISKQANVNLGNKVPPGSRSSPS